MANRIGCDPAYPTPIWLRIWKPSRSALKAWISLEGTDGIAFVDGDESDGWIRLGLSVPMGVESDHVVTRQPTLWSGPWHPSRRTRVPRRHSFCLTRGAATCPRIATFEDRGTWVHCRVTVTRIRSNQASPSRSRIIHETTRRSYGRRARASLNH